MNYLRDIKLKLVAGFCAILFSTGLRADATLPGQSTSFYTMDNGMQVILKESHGAPMIASVIFVRSGSKYESKFENGITHFLEHLLFDGTTNLSRQQLDESIRDLGGYINAFTRKELTAYLVLVPRQFIDYGMTVQADMLFNSTIPDVELPKERKVVIEEINRDFDSPGYAADAFFTEHAYRNTPYDRPVLGYKAFIENIPRAAIIEYWKRYYRPSNMTLMAIGDFRTEDMKKVIDAIFSNVSNPTVPIQAVAPELSNLIGQSRFDTVANVTSTYINFSIAGPRFNDPTYPAFDLLSRYLGMEEVSPLYAALKSSVEPLVEELNVSLTTCEEFTRQDISIITQRTGITDSIIEIVRGQLAMIPGQTASDQTIHGLKVSNRTQDIYLSERLHYYAFMIAPMMALGYDFVERYPDLFDAVQWSQCQEAAGKWLSAPNYIVTVVRPLEDSTAIAYQPQSLAAEEVTSHFDSTSLSEPKLSGVSLTYPSTEAIEFDWTDNADYRREVLGNGLVCLVKSATDNRVFAMNVLGKNRNANEPDGKAGLTDFVNHLIEKGTTTRDAATLATDLAQIGATVTLYDNPWIPYDDRYTTRQFSFMKFEAIDEFARNGFDIFSEMLLAPAFDAVEIEKVRSELIGTLGRSSTNPREAARRLFYETLFEGTAYAQPIEGDARTIAGITGDDLRAHHRQYYAPNNIILSIVTHLPADTILSWVREKFASIPKSTAEYHTVVQVPPVLNRTEKTIELDAKQVTLYLGGGTFGLDDSDAVSLDVAATVLSNRLFSNLRERRGLAYSVGAGVTLDQRFGWYTASMGTSAENRSEALEGIILEIEKLRLDGPSTSDVTRARNQIWGQLMSAKLASINQAYYLALDEYFGRPIPQDKAFLEALSKVDVRSVRRAAARAFNTHAFVVSSAGPAIP